MLISCPLCPVRVKAAFRPFSSDELAYVTAAKMGQSDFAARDRIVYAGGNGELMFTILSGWAFRYKTLGQGVRQILDFLLPGDPVGLQSPLTGKVRHDVDALTEVTVCRIAAPAVRSIFEIQPSLGAALLQTLLLDEDRSDRRLLLLGRQRPTQRLAYLMLELRDRLALRDMADGDGCTFPLTYGHMADSLGLSRAQLARSLSELRERGWARLRDGQLELEAPEPMARFCAYDAASSNPARALI